MMHDPDGAPSSMKTVRGSAAHAGLALSPRLLRGIDSISSRLGRKPKIAPHLATGLRGEEAAFFHLRQNGYVVVARRWRTPKYPGDIDLVAWHNDTLCFIEVKTRTGRDIVPAEFAVDQQKQRVLRVLAAIYRKRLPVTTRQNTLTRFDVVAVYLPAANAAPSARTEIEVFAAAFERQ